MSLVILLFAAFVFMLVLVIVGIAIAAKGNNAWVALLALLCVGGLLLGLFVLSFLFHVRTGVARQHAIMTEETRMADAHAQQRAIEMERRAIEVGELDGYELEPALDDEAAADAASGGEDTTDVDEIPLEPAPEWIESAPQYEGAVHTATVACGPYVTLDECQQNLPSALRQATDEYIQWYLTQSGRTVPTAMLSRSITWPSYSAEEDVYDQRRQFSYGPMITRHVRLRFDDQFRKRIDRKWEEAVVAQRLSQTGKVAVTILGLCGLSFIGLKLRCRRDASCRR